VNVPETIVLLHGFSATERSWDAVAARLASERYRPLALDLPGHGAAGRLRPIDFAACVEHVTARAPRRFALAGYSMGGRIALHLALSHPDRVTRLVLISTTAGLEDPAERRARRAADERVARAIEREGVEAFARRWAAQPLFADQPPDVAEAAHADRLRNDAAGLAAALRGVGTGGMAPLWDRLAELTMPATVLVGERDRKFRALGERLAQALAQARLVVVRDAGHAVHLEAAAEVAAALMQGGQSEP
jgi:2-succinyl-6-hydroxy-2,4-cyclohexadiene-1-carboxylate synthase